MKQVHEVHFITELFGKYDGSSLQSYLEAGGFKPLQQLLAGGSEKILKEIDESGLQGRAAQPILRGENCASFCPRKHRGNLLSATPMVNRELSGPGTAETQYLPGHRRDDHHCRLHAGRRRNYLCA